MIVSIITVRLGDIDGVPSNTTSAFTGTSRYDASMDVLGSVSSKMSCIPIESAVGKICLLSIIPSSVYFSDTRGNFRSINQVGVLKSEGLSKSQAAINNKDALIPKMEKNLFRRKIVDLGLLTLFIGELEIHSF
jgi:hypothetical protein